MEGFLRYEFGGLTYFGGAYTWRGLFSEFYGILTPKRELIPGLSLSFSPDVAKEDSLVMSHKNL